MSAKTLADLEAAIIAHHRDTTEGDRTERHNAVVTSWVIGYELSNIVEVDGESVVGYSNDYTTSEGSPNTHASLSYWVANEITAGFNGGDEED